MKNTLLLALLLACVPGFAQINNGGGGGSSIVGTTVATNQQYYYLATNASGGCPSGSTNCTAIWADGIAITDGTSNSTTTFTCPNNDCNFTAADVGKVFWATTQGSGNSVAINTTFVCPQTTIQTVNSTSNVTLANACTASGTANVQAIWGHDDGPTLHALDGSGSPCATVMPPAGKFIITGQPLFIVPPGCATTAGGSGAAVGYPARSWNGVTPNSAIIMTPNFNYSLCSGAGGGHAGTTVCFMTGMNQVNDLFIWGTGLTPASNSNCANASGRTILMVQPNTGGMTGVEVAGICPGETGQGVELASIDENWIGGGAQYVMQFPCAVSNTAIYTSVLDCREDAYSNPGMIVWSGGVLTDVSSWPFVGLNIQAGGQANTRGTHLWSTTTQCAVNMGGATSTWYSLGDFLNVDGGSSSPALCGGGTVQSANTVFKTGSNGQAIGWAGTNFTSLGGNTITGPGSVAQTSAPAGLVGWDILQGSCTGVVASASTIGLFNLGNNTTTTCTSTTTNLGPVMGKAGHVYAVTCYAGTAGNQAADACTVLQNNGATSMTCSLNGATSCTDGATAHQFTYAIGDIITVKVVSGTSTTLANVKASVLAW